MKSKRIITLFIIFVFVTVITVGFFSVFTIKRVDVSFAVSQYGKDSPKELCEELDSVKDENLLFFDTEKIKDVVSKYPYFEVVNLEKSYPNAVIVNLKERRETYSVSQDGDYYVLDENGIVLNKNNKFADNLIALDGAYLTNITIGSKAVCVQDDRTKLLDIVYGMSDILDSTDSVERIELKSMDDSNLLERWRVVFRMRTGVSIVIYDAFDDGLLKIQCALSRFENISDYQKCYNYVIASKVNGEITATYTENEF